MKSLPDIITALLPLIPEGDELRGELLEISNQVSNQMRRGELSQSQNEAAQAEVSQLISEWEVNDPDPGVQEIGRKLRAKWVESFQGES